MSTKRKLPQKLAQPVVKQSAQFQGKTALNESSTVVSGGGGAIKVNINGDRTVPVVNISSDESSRDGDSEADDDQDERESAAEADVTMEDAELTEDALAAEDTEGVGEPSFGDLVRANNSEPIDVAGAFEDAESGAVAYPKAQLQTPSGASLGTVLTQALRTNDIPLLESCLQTREDEVIRATVQRLQSPLAGTLLHKLAERLHKRPGRAGKLLVWVQWTLVAHGGYLATQPALVTKLTMLQKVLDGRSRGLQGVLTLKGKLDMLDAQVTLRRKMRAQQRRVEDDDDEGVIYVEGQESEEEEGIAMPQRLAQNGGLEPDGDSDESEDMPMTNGEIADSEDEEDSDEGDLIDEEAEETDADSGDEDEVDHDEQDSMDEDDESDDGVQLAPPSKIAKVAGQFSKRR